MAIEIVDTIPKGGDTITFNVTSQWKFNSNQAELRFFYRGINTVAEYHNNGVMSSVDDYHYTRSVNHNAATRAPLQVGDRLEFELSQFLDNPPNGRSNYYGTAILYVVGRGVVPWEVRGDFEDSYPIPEDAWLGGNTILPYQYSDERDLQSMQMPTNLSYINGQNFVEGRRVHHTDFGDGSHNESGSNPDFDELSGKLGDDYINRSCICWHEKNGRALPPQTGEELEQYVVKVGDGSGNPHPRLGSVLQPQSAAGSPEASVSISG